MFQEQFFPTPLMPNYGIPPVDQYQLVMQQAEAQVLMGLQTRYASTGYPIDLLHGGAHIVAQLAAIGGGALRDGGGGVLVGVQRLIQLSAAYGAYYGYQQGLQDGRRLW